MLLAEGIDPASAYAGSQLLAFFATLLGHSDSRVTKLYDRRKKQVTRNIVERISV